MYMTRTHSLRQFLLLYKQIPSFGGAGAHKATGSSRVSLDHFGNKLRFRRVAAAILGMRSVAVFPYIKGTHIASTKFGTALYSE